MCQGTRVISNARQYKTNILTRDSATGDLFDPLDFNNQEMAAVLSQLILIRLPFKDGPHNMTK